MLELLIALVPQLIAPGPAVVPPAPSVTLPVPVDKELEEAAQRLRRAIGTRSEAKMKEALDAVVALGSAGAASILEAEFARTSQERHRHEDELVKAEFALARKQEMLAVMEVRAERDDSLGEAMRALRKEVVELTEHRDRTLRKAKTSASWCKLLGEGAVELFGNLGSGARRKAEQEMWGDVEEHPQLGVRIGAVELLGRIGGPGTTLKLHKLVLEAHGDRVKLQRKMPKLEKEVREFERRLQTEAEEARGNSMMQYRRVCEEAARAREEITVLAHFIEAASEAGGRALDREDRKAQAKALTTLLRGVTKGKDGSGMRTLDLLTHAESPVVAEQLRALLAESEEPLQRAELITTLARLDDRTIETDLIERYLVDASWHVRSRAAAALAVIRSRAAIPVLIARLAEEDGRVRDDLSHALTSLTGKSFGMSAPTWTRWWADEGAGFEVSEEEPVPEGTLDAKEALGVTFFGIKTASQRVLVILDVSGSMAFSMVPRNNPNDRQGVPPDMPRDGEDSRLAVAKRELNKALGGIRDGGFFNIVLYASDVWTWEDELVLMEPEARSDALRFVESLTAVGGTNIYGALTRAFELVGVKDGDEWCEPLVDTIFLLSDGQASVGVTTDSEQILSFVRERNRSAGIVIHTIGLSGAQDAYLLGSLAEQNGGAYAAR